jgi:hypothetical protein
MVCPLETKSNMAAALAKVIGDSRKKHDHLARMNNEHVGQYLEVPSDGNQRSHRFSVEACSNEMQIGENHPPVASQNQTYLLPDPGTCAPETVPWRNHWPSASSYAPRCYDSGGPKAWLEPKGNDVFEASLSEPIKTP